MIIVFLWWRTPPFEFYLNIYIDIQNGIYNLNYVHTLNRIGRKTGAIHVFQLRHSHDGCQIAVLVVDERLTTISNWSNTSTSERRYNFFKVAKPLSTRQRAWHQVLNSTCLSLFLFFHDAEENPNLWFQNRRYSWTI